MREDRRVKTRNTDGIIFLVGMGLGIAAINKISGANRMLLMNNLKERLILLREVEKSHNSESERRRAEHFIKEGEALYKEVKKASWIKVNYSRLSSRVFIFLNSSKVL